MITSLYQRCLADGRLFAVLSAAGFSLKAIFVKLAYAAGPVDAVTLLAMRMGLALPLFLWLLWLSRGQSGAPMGLSGVLRVLLLDRGIDSQAPERSPWLLTGAKTLSYAVNMAALRYARAHGADDVVFTSADGYLLEGPTSTVLIVRTGADGTRRLLTPLRQKGILAGTSQAVIFAAAGAAGWELGYGPLVPADLQGAEGVWLVSSVRGVLPVRAVDGVEIPVDHELTGMLQAHLDADGDPGRHVSGDPVPTAG